jgi:hypothetical protein
MSRRGSRDKPEFGIDCDPPTIDDLIVTTHGLQAVLEGDASLRPERLASIERTLGFLYIMIAATTANQWNLELAELVSICGHGAGAN